MGRPTYDVNEHLKPENEKKNLVKAMELLKKLLKSWFDEIFFSEKKFLVFPHCVPQQMARNSVVCTYC